jgi:trigger factor
VKFEVEVDVRPEISLPDFSSISLSVDDVVVSDKDVEEQLESLRVRFGTLTAVEKKVETGDFVSIDLVAKIDGKEVEGGSANGISYEVGSNRMIDGLDAALDGMSAGEKKSFQTQLVGQKEGETGDVEVTLQSVKKRELPDLNDEFAKLASEFENLEELRGDLRERLTRVKSLEQGAQARDNLLKHLLDTLEIPVPQNLVEEEVNSHLEKEERLDDDVHRKEVTEEINRSVRADFLLDAIVKAEEVQVSESELTEYLIRTAARYQMTPEQFANRISQGGQIAALMAEVARTKALAVALEKVKITDASGNQVDLSKLSAKPAEAPAGE